MHVGLNLIYLVPGETGGMEVYARELVPRLVAAAPEHRFTVFVNRNTAGVAGPWHGDGIELVTVPVDARHRLQWVRGEQQLLPPLAHRAGVEIIHSFASTAPVWGRFRRVVTIHDLIYRTVPEAHRGLRSFGMRLVVPLAARSSHRIITDSRSTAADLTRHLGVAAAKIDVVHLGIGTGPLAAPIDLGEARRNLDAGDRTILLSVSAKLAHKNLLRLLSALALIERSRRPLLVLPGYPTPHEDELRARAAQLGLTADVRFPGWVSAAELEALYAAATAFVFPSLAEGFGLPVLEAMARGVPVACTDRGSLAEVAGDAALLFDPVSEPSIARAILALIEDRPLRERLVEAGRERVSHFSWSATAEGTLSTYRAVS